MPGLNFQDWSRKERRARRRRRVIAAILVVAAILILLLLNTGALEGIPLFLSSSPTPTNTTSASPTLDPTTTPRPPSPTSTRTPVPEDTPTPTRRPPSPTPSATRTRTPPENPSTLLFISEGRLGQWNPVNDQVSLLAPLAVDYVVSGEGYHVAVIRGRGLSAETAERFDLEVHNVRRGISQTLMEEASFLYGLQISFSGQWIAYTTQEDGGAIRVLRSAPGEDPVEVASCGQDVLSNCTGSPIWSPERAELAWSDAEGLWTAAAPDFTPRLAHPPALSVRDPGGQVTELQVTFDQLRWSPNGRYVLVYVSPTQSPVRWQALIDTRTGRSAEVPGTFGQEDPQISLGWLPNGRLYILHPDLLLETWEVLPTRDDLLGHGQMYPLDMDEEGAAPPAWVEPLNDRYLFFSLPAEEENGTDLLRADLRLSRKEVLNNVAFIPRRVHWGKDGYGSLAASDGRFVFVPLNGADPADITEILGTQAHDFTWLPPLP